MTPYSNGFVQLVGFLAAALSFTTSITNSLIYSPRASDEAAASGHLFLSIVNIIWIFYFGTTSDAAAHHWIDSYAITRPSNTQQQHHQQPMSFTSNNQLTAQLQPATPTTYTQAQPSAGLTSNFPGTTQLSSTSQLSAPGLKRDTYTAESVIEEPTSYPHRAKAIYAYEADMKDPNEISFSKGETLEVSADITSKWWTVRKADGTRGIAPSNYLSLES
jgi:SHO1 osmosensor